MVLCRTELFLGGKAQFFGVILRDQGSYHTIVHSPAQLDKDLRSRFADKKGPAQLAQGLLISCLKTGWLIRRP